MGYYTAIPWFLISRITRVNCTRLTCHVYVKITNLGGFTDIYIYICDVQSVISYNITQIMSPWPIVTSDVSGLPMASVSQGHYLYCVILTGADIVPQLRYLYCNRVDNTCWNLLQQCTGAGNVEWVKKRLLSFWLLRLILSLVTWHVVKILQIISINLSVRLKIWHDHITCTKWFFRYG